MQARTALLAGSLQIANEQLGREHERFRAMTELSSDWFWEQDTQSRTTTLVNSVALTAGLAREAYLGKTTHELGWRPVDPDAWAALRKLLEERRPFYDSEHQRADSEGRLHFISNSGAPMYDVAGTFIGYHGVGRDITQRKRAERRALMQHTTTRLLADSTSVRETLPAVIREICATCHWQGGIFLPADSQGLLQEPERWAEPDAEATFERLASCADAIERGAAATAAGLRNSFACPVRAGDQPLGTLEFHFKAPDSDAQAFFDVLRGLALQVGDFIARCDAEARLRGERELLAERVEERTRELSRRQPRARDRQDRRRGREPRQDGLSRHHEPRDPHADERRHRHDRGARARRRDRGTGRRGADDPDLGVLAAVADRRHPRFLQDRGRRARPRARAGGAGPARRRTLRLARRRGQ